MGANNFSQMPLHDSIPSVQLTFDQFFEIMSQNRSASEETRVSVPASFTDDKLKFAAFLIRINFIRNHPVKIKSYSSPIKHLVKTAHEEILEKIYGNDLTEFAQVMKVYRPVVYTALKKLGIGGLKITKTKKLNTEDNGRCRLLEIILKIYYHHPDLDQLLRTSYEKLISAKTGSKSLAAALIGVSTITLSNYLKAFQIDAEDYKPVREKVRRPVTKLILMPVRVPLSDAAFLKRADELAREREESRQSPEWRNTFVPFSEFLRNLRRSKIRERAEKVTKKLTT